MNKALIGIPTAPILNYGEYNGAWPPNEWDKNNRRWERVYGRFNGPSTERQQAVRDTWWKHITPPVVGKFFMGRTATKEHEAEDVVILDCGDNYLFDLQVKIQGMCRWALDNGFDVMMKCDDDTFCHPALFPYLAETTVDYGGVIYNSYCCGGGTGYVFSRRSMDIIANASPKLFPEALHWEDRWMGEVLHAAGVEATSIPGFIDEPNLLVTPEFRKTFHPVSPAGMRAMYREFYGHQ